MPCVETVNRMKDLLRTAIRFNKILEQNKIRSMQGYPELEAIYLGICEKARLYHDQSPPLMKSVWMCFAINTADDGCNIQLKLRLRMDGPLSDRDLYNNPRDRKSAFLHMRETLASKRNNRKNDFARMNWERVNPANYYQALCDMSREIGQLQNVIDGDMERLKFCEKGEPNALMDDVMKYGQVSKIEAFSTYFSKNNEPLVLVDKDANIGAVCMINGEPAEAQPPQWLKEFILYRHNRKVSYGDKKENNKVNMHVDRHRYKQQAIADKKIDNNSRYFDRKRKNDYTESNRESNYNRSYDQQNKRGHY